MQSRYVSLTLAGSTLALALALPAPASTHGDNLIGIGAVSRSLAGTGVAVAENVTAAITANPAALAGTFVADGRAVEFSVTLFRPRVEAEIGARSARSAERTHLIPSFAYAKSDGAWSYGLAAYGISGLGVDYRRSGIDTALGPTPYPLVAAVHTELQVLEVAPAVAHRLSPRWSVGAALHLDVGHLDLGAGRKSGHGFGLQPGVVFRPVARLTLGLSYITPKPIDYRDVIDLDGDGAPDDLRLTAPEQLRLGAAFEAVPGRLRVAVETAWVSWGRAEGYRDFDWGSTRSLAFAVRYCAVPERLTLRAGYSRNGNPVRSHQGWDGTGAPGNVRFVQGKAVNNYYFETFRVIGFPAIVTEHVSAGVEFGVGNGITLDLGFTHAFRSRLTEEGRDLLGAPVRLSSTLSESSVEVALARRF